MAAQVGNNVILFSGANPQKKVKDAGGGAAKA